MILSLDSEDGPRRMTDDVSRDTPPTRQARRRAQTRQRLLDAAQALFARQPVEDTTISQITEEADVGFGSFYNHFASKEEIVEATVRGYLRQQVRVVMGLVEKVADPAETGRDRLPPLRIQGQRRR